MRTFYRSREDPGYGVHPLAPTFDDLLASQEFKIGFGFLTNDAINLAVMKRHHLIHIATNDSDFERVEYLRGC
jgi:predicted nucleic acid-binding protein